LSLLETVVSLPLAGLAILAALRAFRCSRLARQPVRTLLAGSASSLQALREELAFRRIGRYTLVGFLSVSPPEPEAANDTSLATLSELRSVVLQHDVKLILMASEIPRIAVFDAMARDCTDLDVRLCDLSQFYEDTFRYTPIAEINSAWFYSILRPRYRPPSQRLKRVFDIAFALVVGTALLPGLAVLSWLIRRDGGPALFRQVRIGEGGRPFTLYKLRTMGVGPGGEAAWSSAGDSRVTTIGQHLRRWHLDELPQLWNILRGNMSVVGPRPEQPEFVSVLEREFPFYNRRHALRPGLAGWAQARCGYAGSKAGAAWKLSHDLYYLKHRSLFFDLRILLQSIWQAVSGKQFVELPLTPVVGGLTLERPSRAPLDERTELDSALVVSGRKD
jgi:lipopolysaccharide/colanic/teichoic acid biosynthesis glycosyltransferase